MKLKPLSAVVALALGMGLGGGAVAGPTFFGLTSFEDDQLRFFIDNGDGAGGAPNGRIDVGDRIIDVMEISTTAPVFGGGSSVAILPPEFTGISDITVTSKTAVGGGLFNFTFGPTAGGFLSGIAGGAAAAAGAPAGTVARFWDGPLDNLDLIGINCISLADCISKSSDGTLYWNAGFTGAPTEHLSVSNAFDDPLIVLALGANTAAGTAEYGLGQLPGGAGPTVNPQACLDITCFFLGVFGQPVDVLGSGTIQGGQGIPLSLIADGAFSRGDYQFQVAVPEPGTLALVGLSLAGLGLVARRRRKPSA